jgi:hypothetical protein
VQQQCAYISRRQVHAGYALVFPLCSNLHAGPQSEESNLSSCATDSLYQPFAASPFNPSCPTSNSLQEPPLELLVSFSNIQHRPVRGQCDRSHYSRPSSRTFNVRGPVSAGGLNKGMDGFIAALMGLNGVVAEPPVMFRQAVL